MYTNHPLQRQFVQDYSYNRMSHLLKRIDLGAESGYHDFQINDSSLCQQDIKYMSELTSRLLSAVDYDDVIRKRRKNYKLMDDALHHYVQSE